MIVQLYKGSSWGTEEIRFGSSESPRGCAAKTWVDTGSWDEARWGPRGTILLHHGHGEREGPQWWGYHYGFRVCSIETGGKQFLLWKWTEGVQHYLSVKIRFHPRKKCQGRWSADGRTWAYPRYGKPNQSSLQTEGVNTKMATTDKS